MVKNLLGREYEDSINVELSKLKQSDRILVDDVMAVIKRADTLLGRESSEVDSEKDRLYVVLKPTKYSIVSGKYLKATSSKESKIILISLTDLVNQMFEFNFAYTQLLFNNGIMYQTNQFRELFDTLRIRFEYTSDLISFAYYKCNATAYGIFQDVLAGKFKKEDILEDRLFIIYKLYETLKFMDEKGYYRICSEIKDRKVYTDLVINKTPESIDMLKDFFGKLLNKFNELKKDKEDNIYKLSAAQCKLMDAYYMGGYLWS